MTTSISKNRIDPHSISTSEEPSAKVREALIRAAEEQGYIPEETFLLKCHTLSEILSANKICYIVGPPGAGKTAIWKTLASAFAKLGKEVLYNVLYSQTLSHNELLEHITSPNYQKDIHLRMADLESSRKEKWVILDGHSNLELVETLNHIEAHANSGRGANNLQVQATQLLIETTELQNTTVSLITKGPLFYIKDEICWKWLARSLYYQKLFNSTTAMIEPYAKKIFQQCFEQHFILIHQSLNLLEYIVPLNKIAVLHAIWTLINALIEENVPVIQQMSLNQQRTAYEGIYLFAAMWSLGGSLSPKADNINYHKFDQVWREKAIIKYPEEGLCLDYYFDTQKLTWINWATKVQDYRPKRIKSTYLEFYVPTAQTIRLEYLLDQHVKERKSVLLAGPAGTGKTVLMKNYLESMNSENYTSRAMSFNGFVSSEILRRGLNCVIARESSTKHRTQGNNRKVLYFIDDLSLSTENYHIQSSYALMRQLIEEDDLSSNYLAFLACCDPHLPSLTTDLRLLRHFSTYAMMAPEEETIQSIYISLLNSHIPKATLALQELIKKLVQASLIIFRNLINDPIFSLTQKKFHYKFGLRDFSQVTQGLMMMSPEVYCKSKDLPQKAYKLWVHEWKRTIEDKLVATKDIIQFNTYLKNAFSHLVTDKEDNTVLEGQAFFTSFISEHYGTEKSYLPIEDFSELKSIIEEKLIEYNLVKPHMNLTLFDAAIAYIIRITRILNIPGGHGLIVGIPGSGRQSLAKLSAFILNIQVYQTTNSEDQMPNRIKRFLIDAIKKFLKQPEKPFVLLISDSHLRDESDWIIVNDLVTFGFIPGLFDESEISMDPEFVIPQPSVNYLRENFKKNMHVLLMVSPLGSDFRGKVAEFPGIMKSTMIVWLHEWTRNALIELGEKFLNESEVPSIEACKIIETHMKEFTISSETVRDIFVRQDNKSLSMALRPFQEFLQLHLPTIGLKNASPQFYMLEKGLQTLSETKQEVQTLQEDLYKKVQLIELQTKQILNLNNAIVQESEKIKVETKKIECIKANLTPLVELCERERDKLNPICEGLGPVREQQRQALDQIERRDIYEIMAFMRPPDCLVEVGHAIVLLLSEQRVLHDGQRDNRWDLFRSRLADPLRFIYHLRELKIEDIPLNKILKVKNIIEASQTEGFNFDFLSRRSRLVGLLGKWVLHSIDYYDQYQPVKPLIDHFEEMSQKVRLLKAQLLASENRVQKANYCSEQKIEETKIKKRIAEQDVANLKTKIEEAEKLVLGLALTRLAEIK